jgi:hypothetical protein
MKKIFMNNIKTHTEMISLQTFKERFEYLKIYGTVGNDTFGFDRYINQKFYKSLEWRRIRDSIIIRDNGCDLGCEDRPITGRIIIHHMNPISVDDLTLSTDILFDAEYLVCTSLDTHNAIHYGDISLVNKEPIIRLPNDTIPWK